MILIDTSALIASLCGARQSADNLEKLLVSGEQIAVSSMVLYEWLRGPRAHQELLDVEMFLPREKTISFGAAEAAVAADLYKRMKGARGREMDLAIAATALVRNAALWTLNPDDFRDIPGLRFV